MHYMMKSAKECHHPSPVIYTTYHYICISQPTETSLHQFTHIISTINVCTKFDQHFCCFCVAIMRRPVKRSISKLIRALTQSLSVRIILIKVFIWYYLAVPVLTKSRVSIFAPYVTNISTTSVHPSCDAK